jgi:hypothetical protein
MRRRLLPGAVLLGLAACAPEPQVTAETCRAENWQALGRQAGEAGEPASAVDALAAACAPFGPPFEVAWALGYEEGLAAYCTPERGYELGFSGTPVAVTCPADRQAAFDRAYVRGRRDGARARPAVHAGVWPGWGWGWGWGWSWGYGPWYGYPPYYRPPLHRPPVGPPPGSPQWRRQYWPVR